MSSHTLSLYGINNDSEIVIGKKGSIAGVTGFVGIQNRKCLDSVKKLKELADNTNNLHKINYESTIL